ncbi:MAG: N4-gp56 family major capsid protein [Patescibacteria group bacterium]|nr:N4-gp56 family major capsid protein [Patescibacteria group bacterium]
MAVASTTNPADFANRRQTYFSRELLKATEFNLRMAQFAQRKSLPANSGTNTIRFFRPRKARKATGGMGPQNLTEGVTALHNSEVSVGYVDCALNQRGDDFTITDLVKATDILDTVQLYTKTVGQDAALDFDTICTASILGNASTALLAKALGLGAAQTTLYNSNRQYGKATANCFERFAGVVNANPGNSAADFASLAALSKAQGKFTRLEHLRALTQLRANDVHAPDGKVYPVITPPEVMFDIRQDGTLVAAMTQRDNAKLYKWEEFEMDGGAFIESTNPWQESAGVGYGNYDGNGTIFSLLYLGDEAFGVPKLSNNVAGGDPTAPKMIILDSPDKSDPYNQRVVGAWKCFYGAILILTSDASDVPRVCALRVQSSFQ